MIETHKSDISPENKETASLNGKIQFLSSGDPLYRKLLMVGFHLPLTVSAPISYKFWESTNFLFEIL